MVLAIKIKDNINVFGLSLSKFNLGFGYIQAQDEIRSIFNINNDVDFDTFQNSIFNNFEFNPAKMIKAYNLYYLANSLEISKKILDTQAFNFNQITTSSTVTDMNLLPLENQLNYFGFNIKKYPNKSQFLVLNDLKTQNIIESYWIEGDTSLPIISKTVSLPPLNPTVANALQNDLTNVINDYEKDLDYKLLNNRGLGATIIDFEEDATSDILIINNSNIFLKNFSEDFSTISFIGNNRNGDFGHQIFTFQVLFAQPDTNEKRFQVNGICPKVNTVISSLKPLLHDDYMASIRNNLTEIQNLNMQNAILLFEFETDINPKKRKSPNGRFPVTIYPEINNRLEELVKMKNLIILQGSGNIGIDFDALTNAPWEFKTGAKYNNLKINNPNIIMVGGVKKDFNGVFQKIESSNTSKSMDVLMYSDILLMNLKNIPKRYGGSSAAVAVCAGIVAYLQGRALQGAGNSPEGLPSGIDNTKRVLTVKIIKALFQKTFNKERSAGVLLSPFKLEELWIECQKELNLQPSQHQ